VAAESAIKQISPSFVNDNVQQMIGSTPEVMDAADERYWPAMGEDMTLPKERVSSVATAGESLMHRLRGIGRECSGIRDIRDIRDIRNEE
jgi:hypothetical protein